MKTSATMVTVAAVLAISLLTGTAAANGLLVGNLGGDHGHPTTTDPSAIYFNPAGLSLSQGTRLQVSGLFVYRQFSYERPVSAIDRFQVANEPLSGTPEDALTANAGRASLLNFMASPFIAAVSDFGVPNLGVGAGFFIPFGGQAHFDRNAAYAGSTKYPGAVDGVQRWAGIDGSMVVSYGTVAVGYRLPRLRLSLGVGASIIMTSLETVRARNADGSDDLVTATGALQEGRGYLKASGTTGGISAGVVYQPTARSWLGLSYQSQPGFGKTTLTGTMESKLGPVAEATPSDIVLEQELPDLVRLGARYRPRPTIELRAAGEYVRWSVLERQCVLSRATPDRACKVLPTGAPAPDGKGILLVIERDWHDAFGARVGGSYWLRPHIELLAGLGYDGSAAPDRTLEPSFADMNMITASLGARLQVTRRVAADATYTQAFCLERTTQARPRDTVSGRLVGPVAPSKSPDGAGTYRQQLGFLSLSLLLSL
jgi:long-chain fatty acid transport protein